MSAADASAAAPYMILFFITSPPELAHFYATLRNQRITYLPLAGNGAC
jgi:hypothetical protein